MGSWFMHLSDYMGGRRLWKCNSMGGWVQKKCLLPPPGISFWNSPNHLMTGLQINNIFGRKLSIFNYPPD